MCERKSVSWLVRKRRQRGKGEGGGCAQLGRALGLQRLPCREGTLPVHGSRHQALDAERFGLPRAGSLLGKGGGDRGRLRMIIGAHPALLARLSPNPGAASPLSRLCHLQQAGNRGVGELCSSAANVCREKRSDASWCGGQRFKSSWRTVSRRLVQFRVRRHCLRRTSPAADGSLPGGARPRTCEVQ